MGYRVLIASFCAIVLFSSSVVFAQSNQLQIDFIGPKLKNVEDVIVTEDNRVFLSNWYKTKTSSETRPTIDVYSKKTGKHVRGYQFLAKKFPKKHQTIKAENLVPTSNGGYLLCSEFYSAVLDSNLVVLASWYSDGSVYSLLNYKSAAEGENYYIFYFTNEDDYNGKPLKRGYVLVNKKTYKRTVETFDDRDFGWRTPSKVIWDKNDDFIGSFQLYFGGKMCFEKLTPKSLASYMGNEVEWRYNCSIDYAAYGDLIKTKDGNFVSLMLVNGSAHYGRADYEDEIRIRKFTSEGKTVLWDKIIVIKRDLKIPPIYGDTKKLPSFKNQRMQILENSEGGFYLFARSEESNGVGEDKVIIYKLDDKGNVLKTKVSKEIKYVEHVHYIGNNKFEGQTDKGWVSITF